MIRQKKIIVVGCPGSGKSYFSNKLSKLTKIPLYHLDKLYWKPNWVSTPREEFRKIINEIMNNNEWIIDGNYNGTIEERFTRAELVYFLDIPTEVCISNEKQRRGNKRQDFPDYLEETEDLDFIEYIKSFKDIGRLKILSWIKRYPSVEVIVFTSGEEIKSYLKNLYIM